MHGIVALLDREHTDRVLALWDELERAAGVRAVRRVTYPHVSLHVAAEYDRDDVDRAMTRLAARIAPFEARTAGLGVFGGPEPVVYIPVVRTMALSDVHARVGEALAPHATGSVVYYDPDRWVPHITLAQHDVRPEMVPTMLGALGTRPLDWTPLVYELGLLWDPGDGRPHELRGRYALRGNLPPAPLRRIASD